MKRISKTEIKEMRSQSKKNRIMFAFTLPTVILYTIFFLVTMLIGVYYSFTDWNGISKDYTFVGLKNYVKVLTDERFREALWFNIGYTIALVVLLIGIPLTIALALNRIRRLSTLFRSIYFIPAVISMVTVGLIWNELFYRAVPAIGEMLNIEALSTSPLGNPKLAAIAIMVVNIWQGCAIPTVLFIAGLQSVPKDLLEAATIDGAGNWARFWNVIIPYLIPVLNMVIITQAKAGLTVFDYIKVMTNGGPAQSTEAVGLLIYRHAINEGKFTISVCHVKKQSENIISFLEAHQYACEGLLPLDGDVIIFVGIMDSDFRTESIEAFYVPKGTFVKLNPLIVHGTQYPVDKEDVHIVCMLPGRTFKNDMLSRRLETGEQIRITRGYKK